MMSDISLGYRFHTTTTGAWQAMLDACAGAKRSIRLEEFVLAPDTIGSAFVDMFVRKASEGVAVILVLDWFGCKDLAGSDHHRRLTAAGVKVLFFKPPSWRWLLRPTRFFPRDHRKLLIIDEETTFVGGVCIYDEITHWRDTMVELNGSITRQFIHIFEKMQEKISGDAFAVKAHPDFETDKAFTVFANAPDSGESHFTETLIRRIDAATDSVRLVTPYFAPGGILLPALERALARGVTLTVLLSDYSEYAPYVAGKTLCGNLIKKGARIYYYKLAMLHLKMMIIDEAWAAIGSCNLDGLSMRQNQEVMLVSVDEAFVRALHTHYDEDKAVSEHFLLADWKARPLSQKITGRIAACVRHFI